MATNFDLKPGQLARARELLEVALGPRAKLLAPQASDNTHASEQIDVRLPNGKRARLVLEPLAARQQSKSRKYRVLVLNRASAMLLERLRRERQNFVDISRGTVCLELPSLVIDRTGLKPARRKNVARPLRDPFADRASLVARTLVDQPGRTWKSRELAAHAGVSTMTASHVVRQLHQMGVLQVQRSGRTSEIRLVSVKALVELWAAHYEWTRNPRMTFTASIGTPSRFLPRLRSALGKHRWALTLHAGASLVAPHATWEKIHLYMDVQRARDLADAFSTGDYEPSDQGRLIVMQPWYRDSVWHGLRSIEGFPVVSDLQLSLDLWHYKVRGREQAEHLLAKRWSPHFCD